MHLCPVSSSFFKLDGLCLLLFVDFLFFIKDFTSCVFDCLFSLPQSRLVKLVNQVFSSWLICCFFLLGWLFVIGKLVNHPIFSNIAIFADNGVCF